MSMEPSIETRQPESQATPLSEDVVQLLENRISQFGAGMTGTRQAGTAIRQFVESGPGALPEEQQRAIEQTQSQARERALDQIGEEFSVMGGTQGSPAGFTAAETMSRLAPRQTQQRFAEQRRRAAQQLSAAGQLAQISQAMQQPFLNVAQQGIMPEQTIVGESPFSQISGTVGGLLQGAGRFAQAFSGPGNPGGQNPFGGGEFRRFPRGTQGDLNPEGTTTPGATV